MCNTTDERYYPYRIFFEFLPSCNEDGWDLEEGWYISGLPCNECIYGRSPDKSEAALMDKAAAVVLAAEFRQLGYPCRIVPEIPAEERLAILEGL